MTDDRADREPPGPARRLDARLKLLLLIGASFATQYQPAWCLPLWLAGLCCLYRHPELRDADARAMTRGGLAFAGLWFLMLFGYETWKSGAAYAAAATALPLALRLVALAVLGIAFAKLSPPVETGRAVAWFLRPFLGRNAWRAGLALALVAWFLPSALRLVHDVNASIALRHLRLTWRRRVFLVSGTALRLMERKAWDLALGLTSRRLDQDNAWR